MSVVTVIGSVASLNEMKAALAGVVPTKQTPMSASGPNSCFRFIASLLYVAGVPGRTPSSASFVVLVKVKGKLLPSLFNPTFLGFPMERIGRILEKAAAAQHQLPEARPHLERFSPG